MLIRRPGQPWHPFQPALHDERALQTLLVQSPSLLPSPGPGELAVAANFRIGAAASVDLLGVGVDGRIVLVECGRQEGPGRRPMGGAALAVGAGLWRAPYEEFDRAFAVRAGAPLLDKVAAIARAGRLAWDEAAFRAGVTDNLIAGRFQLILAVDVVSEEVRQVVAYLNAGARPGLGAVALGLRYHAEEGVEILIPSIFQADGGDDPPVGVSPDTSAERGREVAPTGGEVSPPAADPPQPAAVATATTAPAPTAAAAAAAPAATAPATSPAAPAATAPAPAPAATAPAAPAPGASSPFARPAEQSEHGLFTALEASCLPAAVDAFRRLYHIARDRGRELQWGSGDHPAVTAVYEVGGKPVGVWSCYTDLKPSFVVNFEWLAPHVPVERLARLADRLAELPSVPERLSGLAEAGYKRRLALALNAVLAQPGAADVINSALTELLDPASARAATAAPSIPPPPPAVAGRGNNNSG